MDIREELEQSRRELLDLSNRNRLLLCSEKSRSGLRIVDELSDDIHRILVSESRSMSFLPGWGDSEEGGGESEGFEFGQPDASDLDPDRHTDTRLQTALSDEQLQKKLLRLYRDSRTLLEEQGVNTLYLALGFLHWKESASSDHIRRAPLILVPVEISRGSVRARFRLTYSNEEIGANLSLEEKLRIEFGIKMPAFPDSEELTPSSYYKRVSRAISKQPAWTVEPDEMQLGFFSFTKLLMYRDLDPAEWPKGKEPYSHEILSGLLGKQGLSRPGDSSIAADAIDEHPEASDLATILDADSSQLRALIEARTARVMVIQGPPGTGKSQTIANLIADAVLRGKKVLFVAEKMAALEVVKRRLDENEIGDACLEIHSRAANKKTVLAELERTLRLGMPIMHDAMEAKLLQLTAARDQLTRYAAAVNQPIGDTGISPRLAFVRERRAMSHLETGAPMVALGQAGEWKLADFNEKRGEVEALQARLSESGHPRLSPYWGSARAVFLPSDREVLFGSLDSVRSAIDDLDLTGRRLADSLGVDPPKNGLDSSRLDFAVKRLAGAPSLEGCKEAAPHWPEVRAQLSRVFDLGDGIASIRGRFREVLLPDAWGRDVLQLRADLRATGGRWFRFILPRWHSARAEFEALCLGESPLNVEAMLRVVDAILDERRLRSQLESERSAYDKVFDSVGDLAENDWPLRRAQAEWVLETRRLISSGDLPGWSLGFDANRAKGPLLQHRALAVSMDRYRTSVRAVIAFLDFDEAAFGPEGFRSLDFQTAKGRIEAMNQRPDSLRALAAYNQKASRLREIGLAALVEAYEQHGSASLNILALFDHCRYSSLVRRAFEERAALREFNRSEHETVAEKFRELDRLQFDIHRCRATLAHYSGLPIGDSGGRMGILRSQMAKKRNRMPIRKLIGQAGPAIQAIKPVFLMSPLSVAQFLPPGSIEFDMVIFDEASQVRAVDSFGAVLRGLQLIVVGDSKQLPPTAFFDSVVREQDEEEEHATTDIESLLKQMEAKGARSTMLRWHYRSRHESLIAFSNRTFYDSRLNVFPSPVRERRLLGLSFRHLPETVYQRGHAKANNPQEAVEVVEAVMQHARQQLELPELERETLLVATFSATATRRRGQRFRTGPAARSHM